MFFIINLGGSDVKKYIVTLAKEEREPLDAIHLNENINHRNLQHSDSTWV